MEAIMMGLFEIFIAWLVGEIVAPQH